MRYAPGTAGFPGRRSRSPADCSGLPLQPLQQAVRLHHMLLLEVYEQLRARCQYLVDADVVEVELLRDEGDDALGGYR